MPTRTMLTRTLTLLALVLALLLGSASAATAHDSLASSNPSTGAALETAPEKATLVFTGDLTEIGAALLLEGPDGQNRPLTPAVSGREVTAALPSGLSGRQRLKWRVVSSDGHPIEGVVEFTVGTGDPTTTAPASSAPSGSARSSSAPSTAPAAQAAPFWASATGLTVLAAVLGGLVAGLVYALIARRRTR